MEKRKGKNSEKAYKVTNTPFFSQHTAVGVRTVVKYQKEKLGKRKKYCNI